MGEASPGAELAAAEHAIARACRMDEAAAVTALRRRAALDEAMQRSASWQAALNHGTK